MGRPVITRANREIMLSALETQLAMSEMIVFINEAVIDENTVLADLTPTANTMGSPSAALTFTGPYLNGDGELVIGVSCPTFLVTVLAGAETIFGIAITNMAGTLLEVAQLLDEPVPITAVGDGFKACMEIPMCP